jgi:hypothetical protein
MCGIHVDILYTGNFDRRITIVNHAMTNRLIVIYRCPRTGSPEKKGSLKAHTQWRQRYVDVTTLLLTLDLEIQNYMYFIVDRSQ